MMRLGVIDANDMLMEAQLDGRVYNVGLSWNQEGQLWTLSIRDLNFSILAAGIAVVQNYPLLFKIRQPEFPPGEFGVDAPSNIRLGRKSFVDGTANLYYLTAAEVGNAAL